MRFDLKILLLGGCVSALLAQGLHPTCNKCSGSYIANEEIKAYLARVPADAASEDQQIRAVDAGKSNVDIAVVYRGKQTGISPVAAHDQVSEVYHVIDGSATLLLGTDIIDFKRRPANHPFVQLNGPGGSATGIRNGATYQLKAGDVVVIPPGVGHQFLKIDDHIRYLMVRVDPDKVTALKDETASKADLAKGAAAR